MNPSIDMARDGQKARILIMEVLHAASESKTPAPCLTGLSDEQIENLYSLAIGIQLDGSDLVCVRTKDGKASYQDREDSTEEKPDTRIVISAVDPDQVPVIVAKLAAIGIDSTIGKDHKIVIAPVIDSHPIKVITHDHRAPAILYVSGMAIRLN